MNKLLESLKSSAKIENTLPAPPPAPSMPMMPGMMPDAGPSDAAAPAPAHGTSRQGQLSLAMARPAKPNAGVIGLGIIGSRVAANLRKAGNQVWVWNRSPRPEPNFLSSPAEVAESAKIIQIFVSDGPALMDVLTAMAPVLGRSISW